MKHNFNLNQIILLCENGEVTTDDGTKFQITEVKSETVTSNYSHLIGKWVRCTKNSTSFVKNNWYKCVKPINQFCPIIDESGQPNGIGNNTEHFDLSNPLDYNPTDLVGKYWNGIKLGELRYDFEFPRYDTDGIVVYCHNITPSEVTDTPPTKSLKYKDIVGEVKPLCFVNNEGNLRTHVYYSPKHSALNVLTKRDAKKLRATAQLLVVMHAANGGEWIPKDGEERVVIEFQQSVNAYYFSTYEHILHQIYFRTREDAEKALADNKQLFNEYFAIDE